MGEPIFDTDLRDQTALVTGASTGLGRQFAHTLARAGARVVLTSRRLDRLEAEAEAIAAAGGEAFPLALDVADAASIPAALDRAEEMAGPISILVNNAGIPDAQLATRMPLELIDQVIATNLRAPFVLASDVARRLIAAKRPGRIVNIASIIAFHYPMGAAATLYSTTKAALVRMTEVLAVEWARFGINVNAIAPGSFSTEMMDGMIARVGDPSEGFPRKRLGDPSQLDSTLLYLVSPSSDFVTGTCIRVDDGQNPR